MLKFFKFKKEKSFKKEKESLWLNINLYWELAVAFVFITAALALVYGYYLFSQINEEFIAPPVVSSGQIETVKKERIDNVLQFFSAREQTSNQILNSASPVVDPSL